MKTKLREIEGLANAGNYTEALQRLDKLATSNPDDAKIWTTRAHINGHQRNYEEAVADWSKAIALCDKEPHYFYMRGIDLFLLRKFESAVLDFTKVIELCDYYKSEYYREGAYFFRADAYLRLKEFEKGKSDCTHVSDEMQTWTDKLRCKADLLAECQTT